MTTELTKPVARKTAGRHRGQVMIVTIYPGDLIGIRQFRTRTEYQMPLAWVYDAAVKAEVLRKRKLKADKKKR